MAHVVVAGGRILQLATGILQDAATPALQPNTLMGVNVFGQSRSFDSFPFFKNRVREGRGFTDTATFSNDIAINAQGWPTVDFSCFLWEGTVVPSWITNSSAGNPFKGGFIGTGSETVAGFFGGNVANVVHGTAGAYTTFDFWMASQGGFKVTGTGGATTNVYCYLPGYNLGAIDDVTNPNAFTDEAKTFYGQFSHIRTMKPNGGEYNVRVGSSTNRRSITNCQVMSNPNQAFQSMTAAPLSGDTSSTLSAVWPWPTDQYALPFHVASGPTIQGRVCSMTQGATTCTWTDALTATCDTASVGKVGIETFPVEWWISFANACNIGVWISTPILEDGTDYAAGSWSQAVLDFIGTHWTSSGTVYCELANENWNSGMYPNWWALQGVAAVKGYYATSGNDLTSYYAYRLHAFANLARARIPSLFGTKVKQVLAWQTLPGAMFYPNRIMNALTVLQPTPKLDVQLGCIAPYFHPTLGAADSVATIQATANTKAQQQTYTAWCENDAIFYARYGIPFGSYEDGGDWGNGSYSAITNLPAAVLDAGMQTPVTTHYQAGFDAGKTTATHFCSGISVNTWATGSGLYEFTNTYASPLVTAQILALQSFMSSFTPTRNLVVASGAIVLGVNYADNIAVLSAANGSFNVTNSANMGPFVQAGRIPYVIWCTDPRANAGAVTYSLVVTMASVTGGPVTELWYGDAARGAMQAFAGSVAVANGANTLGNITLVKGWNFVVLGRNGAQGTSAQNLITQLQFN